MQITIPVVTAVSFALTATVITHAFYLNKQFYPSVLYLTKSNASTAVIYLQALVMVVFVGKLVRKIFFGQLRAAETEHLMEHAWHAVIETCLAFTVFRDDFSVRFFAMFTLLLFLKCFHWLAEERVDFMERSPVITTLFHIRMMGIVSLLSACDSFFMSHAYFSTIVRGASVQLVFGFEYAILLTSIFMIAMKYTLHTIDLRSVHPWENKAVYILYMELAISFVRVVLYIIFMTVMFKLHTFPLFALRPVYLAIKSFKKAVSDVVLSRRAINYMNTYYPCATAEELASGDNVCIICREEMNQPNLTKKLPCNHMFHFACLRSWFQRQQTCPTCRLDIFQSTNPAQRPAPVPPAAPVAAPAPAAPGGQPQPPATYTFPTLPPLAQQPGTSQGTPATQPMDFGTFVATLQAGGGIPGASTQLPMPFMLPFPQPPNFSGLTDAEVRAMEGQERAAVEQRVRCLRNIQTLLDCASVQLQQYCSILQSLTMMPEFTQTGTSTATPSAEASASRDTNSAAATQEESNNNNETSPARSSGSGAEGEESNEIRNLRLRRFQGSANGVEE